MKNLKNMALVFALVLGMFTAAPKKADAVVGIATGNPVMAIAGLVIAPASGYVSLMAALTHHGKKTLGQVSFLGMIAGVILLDGEEGQQIAFDSLSEEQVKKLEITKDEQKAYENNLEELSLISNIVSSELDEESTLEDSQIAWERYKILLPEEALIAAQKIISASVN